MTFELYDEWMRLVDMYVAEITVLLHHRYVTMHIVVLLK